MFLFIGSNGNVAAFDPATGQQIWRTALPSGLMGPAWADVCVLEHDGRVFAGSSGHLFALDAMTGQILWHNDLRGMGHDDVTLSIGGKSIQFVATVERRD